MSAPREYDMIVLGAGPAGAEAAVTAAAHGLSVLVLDEARSAGGQVYRASAAATESRSDVGTTLRRRLAECGASVLFEHVVWMVSRAAAGNMQGDFEIAAVGPSGALSARAKALIVATGAIERSYPRPGWTLPGVVGLAAATVLLKANRILPGQRVVVAGPGPLAPLVASLILKGGGQVAALVDPNPLSVWLRELPALAARPDLLLQGAAWLAKLAAVGVPIYRGWDVQRMDGEQQVERVTLAPVDRDWRPLPSGAGKTIEADAVCLGYGLVPASDVYRLLGARQIFAPQRGGWVPQLDDGQRTSVARLYGAGDGAGLAGAAAAPLSGRLAALSALHDMQRIEGSAHAQQSRAAMRALQRAQRFGGAMARMVMPRSGAMRQVNDATIVCRCEDISAGELRLAIAAGVDEINALKSVTRCGMGPCGGRVCGEAAAALLECAGVTRECSGQFSARPPLRPVPLALLTGTFDYGDIPIPELSPA